MKSSAIDFSDNMEGLSSTVALAAVTNNSLIWFQDLFVFHRHKARKQVCRYRKTEKNIYPRLGFSAHG